MIEEVCMIATDLDYDLRTVILSNTLMPSLPRDQCSCVPSSTTGSVSGTCIAFRTVCSPTQIH